MGKKQTPSTPGYSPQALVVPARPSFLAPWCEMGGKGMSAASSNASLELFSK